MTAQKDKSLSDQSLANKGLVATASKKVENDPWVPLEVDPTQTDACVDLGLPVPHNPLYQIIDSEKYIQTLEHKLSKLTKKRAKEPTSRDIINSLAGFHEDQMRRYIDDSVGHTSSANGAAVLDDSSKQSSFLRRRLYPERQPLNAEEIAELLKEDVLAEKFEEMNIVTDKIGSTLSEGNAHAFSDSCQVKDNTSDTQEKSTDPLKNSLTPNESPSKEDTGNEEQSKSSAEEENWANIDQMAEGSDS